MSVVSSMGWSMDTQATSPAGRPAIDPESQGSGPADPGPTDVRPTYPTDPSGSTLTPGGSAPSHPERTASAAGIDPQAAASTAGIHPQAAASPAGVEDSAEPRSPGFRERGRMRRRVRFLRKARELAYRDLGGLVFEMHRMGQRHDELVAAKLSVLASFDGELRTLEATLGEHQSITVLRETGIAACPRCAAIHGSYDHFCPVCGMPMGRHADRPIAATPAVVGGAPAAVDAAAPRPALAPPSASTPPTSPAQPSPGAPSAMGAPTSTQRGSPAPDPAPPSPSAPSASQPPAPQRPTPAATGEDQPTKIIRPQDDAE